MAKYTDEQKSDFMSEAILKAMQDPGMRQQAWKGFTGQMNPHTGNTYTGGNALYLSLSCMLDGYSTGERSTFNGIKKMGGKLIKGSAATYIKKVSMIPRKDKQGNPKLDSKQRPILIPKVRWFAIFNLDQTDLTPALPEVVNSDNLPLAEAETISSNYLSFSGIKLTNSQSGNWYAPKEDVVNLIPMNQFDSSESYYKTMFHELVHSTGHASRLAREGIIDTTSRFGDTTYSKEELVAEFGAAMMCATLDIEVDVKNSAAYLASRSKKIKSEGLEKDLGFAIGKGREAIDFIINN